MGTDGFDVVVVGSGIAGTTAALEAARAGARVALYAHASNGGIRIAPDARCIGGPTGLFACGECAGGMHGADRIGGLASASALVFGRIAGAHAADEAGRNHASATVSQLEPAAAADTDALLEELQRTLSTHAMTNRTETGLTTALRKLDNLQARLRETVAPSKDLSRGVATQRLQWQLASARAMLQAMLVRRHSCGSHHRADDEIT